MTRPIRNALTLALILVAIGSCRTVTGPDMACYELRPDSTRLEPPLEWHIVHRWHRLDTPECEGEPLPVGSDGVASETPLKGASE